MNKSEQISAEKSNPVSKKNENLHRAKEAKKDKFYTQLSDCSAQINLAGSNQHFIQLIYKNRKGGSRRNTKTAHSFLPDYETRHMVSSSDGISCAKKDDNRTNSCD